jgi:outer membrane protein insertion porin family/translocation and assembly module TamA
VAAALFLTAACKEDGTGIKIDSLKFTGLHAVTAGQLESVLATRAPSRLPWGAKTYFDREQFEADLKRIVAFYRDRGYPDARITSFEATLNDDQTAVDLTIHIDEGEPVRLEALRIEGLPGGDGLDEAAVRQSLPLQVGQPLDRALVQASRETMLDQLKEHGYPFGKVTLAEQDGSSAKARILTMQVEPGPLVHFGPIEITGNSSVGDNVIRRQLSFRPGDVYQQSKLLDSQRRLYGLELFQFASVKAQTQEVAPVVPTVVTLTEGKHRRLNLGIGYGSEEKARAEVNWRHVNFFGGARTAGVVARYSSLDRGVRLNFSQPYVFSRNYSLTASAQMWHSDEPAFTLDSGGGRLTVMRRFGWLGGRGLRSGGPSTTYVSMTYANELEDYVVDPGVLDDPTQWDDLISIGIDPRTGKGHGQLSSLSFDGGRDTTGYILDARHGYVLNGHVEQAGQWLGGSYDYREVTAEGRYYQSLGNIGVVAVRARAGSIDGAGADPLSSEVPFFKRYFLGGATTLRGWGRYEVAPLALNGAPIGGLTTFNFSTELRFPVWKKLGGVVFLDGGNVWRQPWDYNLNDLHYDVGPGLRYNTPIGPVRVDLGYQLDRIPGLLVNGEPEPRRFRVHFSIGQAF